MNGSHSNLAPTYRTRAVAPAAPVRVVADDRETRGATVQALRALEGVEVEIKRLHLGDYEVDERLLVERKTLPDLAESVKDGRLFRQAARLARATPRGVVILEGTSRDLASSGMSRESLQGALICVTLIYGLPILRSMSPEETAHLMVYAARQMRAVAAGATPRKGVRPKGKRRTQLHILQGLPGVGRGRAAQLLDAFGSIEEVLKASPKELRAVPGVGRSTAEAIRWAVSETPAEYATGGEDIPI